MQEFLFANGVTYFFAQELFRIFFLFSVEDLEMNDGSAEKPYFMSKELMKILGKKNKKEKENSNLLK